MSFCKMSRLSELLSYYTEKLVTEIKINWKQNTISKIDKITFCFVSLFLLLVHVIMVIT